MSSNMKPTSLSDSAYQGLKDLIIRGEIPQGEVVSTIYLSDLLQIGRTPTSNACQRLECEGLIKIIPKQGILITTLTIDDARDLYETRSAIETYVSNKAFDLLNSNDIEILENLIAKQIEAGERKDSITFMQFDTAFHLHILQKQNNALLISHFNDLTDRILIFGIRNSSINQRLQKAIEEHKVLISHIKNHEKESFVKGLEQHIMNGYITLTGVLDYVNIT